MVDLNINIKVPAVEKLVEYAASGIGAVAGSMLAPWKASRERKARITSAQADAEVRITHAESEGEALKIIAKAQLEAKELYIGAQNEESLRTVEISPNGITQRIEFQEQKRLENIKNVIGEAADMLADKKVSDHEPDPDWTARFFNYVQDISSEDMQKIWAKILAGEVERSGKTSLRTMDILRNITKRDAELFKKIGHFVLGDGFIFYEGENTDYIIYGDLLHLQNCGLVNLQTFLQCSIRWEKRSNHVVMYQDKTLEITKNLNTEEALEIPAVWLTESGEELFSAVCNNLTEQTEYLQDFSSFLQSNNCQLFYLEGFENLPDGGFWYRKKIKIEPKSEQPAGSRS